MRDFQDTECREDAPQHGVKRGVGRLPGSVRYARDEGFAVLHAQGLTLWQASRALGLTGGSSAQGWAARTGNVWPKSKHWGPRAPKVDLADLPLVEPDAGDCRDLWCAVLRLQWDAIFDPLQHNEAPQWMTQARAWFGGRDFKMVCALAGLDAGAVMDRFRARGGAA